MGAFGNMLQRYFGGTEYDVSTWSNKPLDNLLEVDYIVQIGAFTVLVDEVVNTYNEYGIYGIILKQDCKGENYEGRRMYFNGQHYERITDPNILKEFE